MERTQTIRRLTPQDLETAQWLAAFRHAADRNGNDVISASEVNSFVEFVNSDGGLTITALEVRTAMNTLIEKTDRAQSQIARLALRAEHKYREEDCLDEYTINQNLASLWAVEQGFSDLKWQLESVYANELDHKAVFIDIDGRDGLGAGGDHHDDEMPYYQFWRLLFGEPQDQSDRE